MDFLPIRLSDETHETWMVLEQKARGKLGATTSLNESQLLAIRGYVVKLGFTSSQSDIDIYEIIQDFQEVFLVPKWLFQQLNHKKNEILAAFVDFLIQILCHRADLSHSFGDRIDVLNKELRFLVTVLGDKVLLGGESELVDNILAEFEAVGNEAGRLVYSIIYSTEDDDDGRLDTLFEHIDLLKANITYFSALLPDIIYGNNTEITASSPSLYIVDSLVRDLEDLVAREDDWIVDDVKDQMKILHQELMTFQSLLKDISLPPNSKIQEMKETAIRIRDLAFGAEYLINSFLVGDAPLWYLTIMLANIIHKIRLMGTKLQEIKTKYDTGTLLVAKDFNAKLSMQPKRNSDTTDDIVVGFEDNEIDVLDQLIGGTERLQIICICGMPGVGKTTLAKKLYKHPSVNYHFDKCSWCVVSQTYQRKNLLVDIVMSLGNELLKEEAFNWEEEHLAEHIYRSLKGRRYIIVIDDIWDSNVWDELRRSFPDDVTGSRILFTSRNKDVAPPHSIIYALPSLTNDQCWELLEKKVFHGAPCPPQLLGIGKEIARNCNGLPLAVVVVAGILSTMDEKESTWKNVGESLSSSMFSYQNNDVMRILKLSYEHLSEHLKLCFLYLGAFPEDSEIHVKKLIRLWIAEGFILKEENKSAENTAEEYLLELIDKSLVIVSKRRSNGGAKACVVHDLLRELCLRIAEEENFLKLMDNNYSIYTKHQRLCVDMSPFLLPFGFLVRSIFCSQLHPSVMYSASYIFKMKLLRVLDLPDYNVNDGDGFEHLVHLRYLAIKSMPLVSIRNLVNLECLTINTTTLDMGFIFSIIHQNVKLRYLTIPSIEISGQDCNSLETHNLEYLSSVCIRKLKDEQILKCLSHLRILKCICLPFLDDDNGVYRYPNFQILTQLESLNMSVIMKVSHQIADLNLPSSIKNLTLSCLQLPWENVSIIGALPNLQVLKLRSYSFVGERWEMLEGEFQQLRFLELEDLDIFHWEVASNELLPRLERLVFRACSNLQQIPCEVGDIPTLQLINVILCSKALAESAREIQQQQLDMGNEELRVVISDIWELDDIQVQYDVS